MCNYNFFLFIFQYMQLVWSFLNINDREILLSPDCFIINQSYGILCLLTPQADIVFLKQLYVSAKDCVKIVLIVLCPPWQILWNIYIASGTDSE